MGCYRDALGVGDGHRAMAEEYATATHGDPLVDSLGRVHHLTCHLHGLSGLHRDDSWVVKASHRGVGQTARGEHVPGPRRQTAEVQCPVPCLLEAGRVRGVGEAEPSLLDDTQAHPPIRIAGGVRDNVLLHLDADRRSGRDVGLSAVRTQGHQPLDRVVGPSEEHLGVVRVRHISHPPRRRRGGGRGAHRRTQAPSGPFRRTPGWPAGSPSRCRPRSAASRV